MVMSAFGCKPACTRSRFDDPHQPPYRLPRKPSISAKPAGSDLFAEANIAGQCRCQAVAVGGPHVRYEACDSSIIPGDSIWHPAASTSVNSTAPQHNADKQACVPWNDTTGIADEDLPPATRPSSNAIVNSLVSSPVATCMRTARLTPTILGRTTSTSRLSRVGAVEPISHIGPNRPNEAISDPASLAIVDADTIQNHSERNSGSGVAHNEPGAHPSKMPECILTNRAIE